ncbi:hypothetical protein BKG80_14565 [Mycobacteroides chelonae]|uniref:hypothetical protein n=1 Tax=Mycobacteroides TaxID=670516 RepID=UPI000715C054|nr:MULTISPECIES: hypothetical protein [Mycobacteroides]KRQ27784.1 hypothetical protein AOT86_10810 [Mycobacteroides sp. H072]KRQ41739.1 hypothetical protein AOT84_00925 [Mycobacteroides sp. H002]KRQ53941.1 hypothetical protein AOT85_06225 [Mycobacteroides sp. H054]KRQ71805.1 hypothetical protein AOT83_06015 [Mycobacteroides sp. H001]MBF9351502.1 hypothetical protein [Mycobacteroides chelonae]
MGGKEPPSIQDLNQYASQIKQVSPEQLTVELNEADLGNWKRAVDSVVGSLTSAKALVDGKRVDVGSVSSDFQSAIDTADNINKSGDQVRANIDANLAFAKALQDLIKSAFDKIKIQSGG